MFWLSSNFKHSGWLPTSVNACCIDLYYSNSQTDLVMVLPSGNFERFGWTADSNEQLLHRSRLIVFDLDSWHTLIQSCMGLLSDNFKRFGLTADFSEHLMHSSLLIEFTDRLVDGFTIGQLQAIWVGSRFQWTLVASISAHRIRWPKGWCFDYRATSSVLS